MIDEIQEFRQLSSWHCSERRHPQQQAGIFEADAEILRWDEESFIAVSTDTIAEEIAMGLYRDPYTIGWVSVMAGLSDIAAVACQPVGVLTACQWGRGTDDTFRRHFANGVADAARACGTYLLGGDTGQATATGITVTALGRSRTKPLTRLGLSPGDNLYLSGPVGRGPCLAIGLLMGWGGIPESSYRPVARFDAREYLAAHARACIDTSDGVWAALDTLCKLNQVGARIHWRDDCLHPEAARFCEDMNLPRLIPALGVHGDYELLFAVGPDIRQQFPGALCIGTVTTETGLTVANDDGPLTIDFDELMRVYGQSDPRQGMREALQRLREMGVR